MNTWAEDALWPGRALVARVQERVPELAEVLCVDEFDPTQTDPRQLPAVVVALAGMGPKDANAMQAVAAVDSDWLVIVAVRNAGREPNANTSEAGPLITKVIGALLGFKAPGSLRAFEWKRGPRPAFSPEVSYFPFLFSLQMAATATA